MSTMIIVVGFVILALLYAFETGEYNWFVYLALVVLGVWGLFKLWLLSTLFFTKRKEDEDSSGPVA